MSKYRPVKYHFEQPNKGVGPLPDQMLFKNYDNTFRPTTEQSDYFRIYYKIFWQCFSETTVVANLNNSIIMKNTHIFLPTFLISVIILTGCKADESKLDIMVEFGQKYTDAWNSKVPEKIASFYAEDGTFIVKNGKPANGKRQLAETAQSYMEAFPDMVLTMDSLTKENDNYRYYWTFRGTNTGPNGTGKKVNFSGFEEWTMNDQGLVKKSIGTYDAEEYARQLNGN